MERPLALLLDGLDRLPSEFRYDKFMMRLVASDPKPDGFEDSRFRSCETVFLGRGGAADADDGALGRLVNRARGELAERSRHAPGAAVNSGIVQILQLEGFLTMISLPDNLHLLFPNVRQIHVVDCPPFSSLSAAIVQFRGLTHISCDGCPSLTSLTSLSSLAASSPLHTLSFKYCGLRVTKDDDWSQGFEGLARMGPSDRSHINVSITECDSLTHLPSSIGRLRTSRRDGIALYFKKNANLVHLPHALGDIPLKTLGIEDCPKISRLPWSLLRLGDAASIDLSKMDGLIRIMGMAREAKAFAPFYTVNPSGLRHYFSFYRKRFFFGLLRLTVLIARAKKRAIDRLCSPGGAWYEASRASFEGAISDW